MLFWLIFVFILSPGTTYAYEMSISFQINKFVFKIEVVGKLRSPDLCFCISVSNYIQGKEANTKDFF